MSRRLRKHNNPNPLNYNKNPYVRKMDGYSELWCQTTTGIMIYLRPHPSCPCCTFPWLQAVALAASNLPGQEPPTATLRVPAQCPVNSPEQFLVCDPGISKRGACQQPQRRICLPARLLRAFPDSTRNLWSVMCQPQANRFAAVMRESRFA